MRPFYYLLLHILALSAACKEAGTPESCPPLKGSYINSTVLAGCPGAMPSDVPHFCFEMTFQGSDRVLLDNGFEKFSLPYTREAKGCMYKIAGASLYGDMFFQAESDSTITLVDTAWTKVAGASIFTKVKETQESTPGFEAYLNDCLLTGQYSLFKDGNLVPGLVDILANGQINGLKPFIGYSICYAGDCLEETNPPARTLELIDDRGDKETFVFKNIEGKMAIELYSIGPPIPDVKGERPIGPMVYELRQE